jgi:hypothetical protein
LVDAVKRFERMAKFDSRVIRRHAEGFSASRFRSEFSLQVANAVREFQGERRTGGAAQIYGSSRNGWLGMAH